ncbi:MAG: prepilin-type N-terminal cleavage/methylation domain-containing protein [Planctomycetaceae bacterium]|nr:prepilin-type N-terminal cleavage/methylation domain-containing protein [Planctomycetaceae bacterium]
MAGSSTSPSRSAQAGFTLVELIAVVVIVGLIAMVTVTRLDFLVPKYRLRGAARDVGSVLGLGKAHAASNGKDVYFEVDLARGTYWLLAAFPKQEPGDDVRTDVRARPLEYQPVFERELPEGVQFTDIVLGDKDKANMGRARARLSALGSSSHLILNMRNDEGKEISVKMNGFTGLITYVEGRQEAEDLLEDPGN